MWAYYGECGEGVCLELTLPSEVMKSHQLLAGPVTYCDAPRVLNRAEDWRTTFLELAEQYPKATIQDLQRMSLEELSCLVPECNGSGWAYVAYRYDNAAS